MTTPVPGPNSMNGIPSGAANIACLAIARAKFVDDGTRAPVRLKFPTASERNLKIFAIKYLKPTVTSIHRQTGGTGASARSVILVNRSAEIQMRSADYSSVR